MFFSSCAAKKTKDITKDVIAYTEEDINIQNSYLELLELTLNNISNKESFRDTIKTLRNPNKTQTVKYIECNGYVSKEIILTDYEQALKVYWQVIDFVDGECFLPFGEIPSNLKGCLGDHHEAIASDVNLIKSSLLFYWCYNNLLNYRGWKLALIDHDGEDSIYILYHIKNKEKVFELVRGLNLRILSKDEWIEKWGM